MATVKALLNCLVTGQAIQSDAFEFVYKDYKGLHFDGKAKSEEAYDESRKSALYVVIKVNEGLTPSGQGASGYTPASSSGRYTRIWVRRLNAERIDDGKGEEVTFCIEVNDVLPDWINPGSINLVDVWAK